MIWSQLIHTIVLNLRLYFFRPVGLALLGVLVIWAIAVPRIGVSKAEFLVRQQELGYPPLSDARLAGLGAGQVASGWMTVLCVWLFINSLDRERENNLDEVLAISPMPGWVFVSIQYLSNVLALLVGTVIAYTVALIAIPFRGLDAFSMVEFLWPGLLFPLGSAFLLAALPLVLDVLNVHQIARAISYGVLIILLNLGPFALAAMTNLDHPRHPLFQVWLTADLGLDTFGVWYLQGYLDLVFTTIEQLGSPAIPVNLFWLAVARPRLFSVGLGVLLALFSAWRFQRFRISSEP
ncbi:MAG: hypothetical protein JW934_13490 [Anaerolineae bacterium]|nr:hypothetical protein [Anaerolineae bacterium]